jgi:hypothetical protein
MVVKYICMFGHLTPIPTLKIQTNQSNGLAAILSRSPQRRKANKVNPSNPFHQHINVTTPHGSNFPQTQKLSLRHNVIDSGHDSPSRSIPGRHYMPAAKEFASASPSTIGPCKDRLHDNQASLPAAKFRSASLRSRILVPISLLHLSG